LAAIHLAGCGGAKRTETVATVGGASITATELVHWSAISERTAHRHVAAARSHALDYLLLSAWLRAEAARRGVVVRTGEVAQQVESRAGAYVGGAKAYEAALAHSGETLADARQQSETAMLYDRLAESVAAQVQVSAQAVSIYYRLHRRHFAVSERRFFLSDSRTSEQEILRDRARLLAGGHFPSRALHETLSRGERASPGPARIKIDRAIFSARVGEVIGPFQNEPIEFHTLLKVTRIVPPRQQTLADVKNQIEHTLSVKAKQQALEAFRRTWEVRWRSVTRCVPPSAAPGCEVAGSGGTPAPLAPTL
jgi:hypothetical protein